MILYHPQACEEHVQRYFSRQKLHSLSCLLFPTKIKRHILDSLRHLQAFVEVLFQLELEFTFI